MPNFPGRLVRPNSPSRGGGASHIVERAREVGMLEDVTAILGHPRKDPRRCRQDVAHLSKREAKCYSRHREQGRPMDCMSERIRKIEVGDGVWRDCVHRPADSVVATRM